MRGRVLRWELVGEREGPASGSRKAMECRECRAEGEVLDGEGGE